jgi:small multidrug resistance pump
LAWILLVIAISVEVGATFSLRASDGFSRLPYTITTLMGYAIAISLMAIIVKSLPVGLVYAIWASSGIALVAIGSYIIFGDALPPMAILGIALIITGVVVLRLSLSSV